MARDCVACGPPHVPDRCPSPDIHTRPADLRPATTALVSGNSQTGSLRQRRHLRWSLRAGCRVCRASWPGRAPPERGYQILGRSAPSFRPEVKRPVGA